MKDIPTMHEAGLQFEQPVDEVTIKSFERKHQVPVPEFIKSVEVISPTQAYNFAREYVVKGHDEYDDDHKFLDALRGLYEIRANGENAIIAAERLRLPATNLLKVSELLNSGEYDRPAIMAQEKERRQKRDAEILTLEAALVRKSYGVEIEASTLEEYSRWLATQVVDRDVAPQAYYAQILKHYSPMTSGLLRSFNPAKEWIDYFEGNYNIGSHWNLRRSNQDKLDFYSAYVVDRQFVDFRSGKDENSSDGLLTHTTSAYNLNRIWKSQRLGGMEIGRVCFSQDRITASPRRLALTQNGVEWAADDEVALIFNKKDIVDTYGALPVVEPGTSHENEYRVCEQVDIRLAVAMIPISNKTFKSYQGTAFGKVSVGADELTSAAQRYAKGDAMFDRETQEHFEHLLADMQTELEES